jgi:ribosomal protein S6
MKDTQKYQMIIVLDPKADKKEELLGKVESQLSGLGGKVAKKDSMGAKDLAYLVKGLSKGEFWNLEVEADKPLKLSGFNVFLNREANIIRYLILKV